MSLHPRRDHSPRHPGERWLRAPVQIISERYRHCSLALPRGVPTRPVGASILIVDDDNFGRETLGKILEFVGYHVSRAADGSHGLRLLARRPGLVLLDLLMPGLDGWEFVQRMQDDPRNAGISVIAMSAESHQIEASSVVGQFQKPVQVHELLAAIRKHLPIGA